MKPLYVESLGLAAPGLDGWLAGASVLRGERALLLQELAPYQPQLLPPNERRRVTQTVRLAFRVAEDAMSRSRLSAGALASVFASSDGDTQVLDRICGVLAEDGRVVSPTDFHNSVHNAASGYWHIATGSRAPSISVSAWDAVFAAGLLESAALIHGDALDVLFATYDVRPPALILDKRPIELSSGVALVLTARTDVPALAKLCVRLGTGDETRLESAELETLRTAGTALRALPLLQLIARREAGSVVLAGTGNQRVVVDTEPC